MAKDRTEKIWNLFFLLLGAVIGFGANYFADWIKENKARKELATMIYFDVRSTRTSLNDFLRVHPREKTIKQSGESGNIIVNATDFDTYVFDAYILKIPTLSVEETEIIFSFYRDLKKANEAKCIINDKDSNLSNDNRIVWIKFLYQCVGEAAKKADSIMKNLKSKYDIKDKNTNRDPNREVAQATTTVEQSLSYLVIPLDSNSELLDMNKTDGRDK